MLSCGLPHGLSATVARDVDGLKYSTEVVWVLCMYIPVCVRNFLYFSVPSFLLNDSG